MKFYIIVNLGNLTAQIYSVALCESAPLKSVLIHDVSISMGIEHFILSNINALLSILTTSILD